MHCDHGLDVIPLRGRIFIGCALALLLVSLIGIWTSWIDKTESTPLPDSVGTVHAAPSSVTTPVVAASPLPGTTSTPTGGVGVRRWGKENVTLLEHALVELSAREGWWPAGRVGWNACQRTRCMVPGHVAPFPSVVLIGEQKGGTTDVSHTLEHLPEMLGRRTKEIRWVEGPKCLGDGTREEYGEAVSIPHPFFCPVDATAGGPARSTHCNALEYAGETTSSNPRAKQAISVAHTEHGARHQLSMPAFASAQAVCGGERVWKVSGDASPRTVSLPQGAMALRSMVPNATVLVMLRDPVQRALSGIRMDWSKVRFHKHQRLSAWYIAEEVALFEAFAAAHNGSWQAVLELHAALASDVSAEWDAQQVQRTIHSLLALSDSDTRVCSPQLHRSFTSVHLLRLARAFPPSQIVLLHSEGVKKSRCSSLTQLLRASCLDYVAFQRGCRDEHSPKNQHSPENDPDMADPDTARQIGIVKRILQRENTLRAIVLQALRNLGATLIGFDD